MDELTELLKEVRRSDSIVVPYTSHGRLKSWMRERFRIKDRRYFWSVVAGISACLVFTSGGVLGVILRIPLLIYFKTPFYSDAQIADINHYYNWIDSFTAALSKFSPVDNFINFLYAETNAFVLRAGSEQTYAIFGILAAVIWVIILSRLFRSRADFVLSEDGIALVWHMKLGDVDGPVVPWSEVTAIAARGSEDRASTDGFIDFVYSKPILQYKLSQAASSAGVNKFSLDLRNLDTLEQRHAVGRAIERWAPPNTVQPEVIENLSATQSHAYTELWLQALTAPSKRQSLDPLTEGKKLQSGKYEIRSQLAVGGQGTAYLAESAEPTEQLSEDDDHVIRLDSANIVVKEFVLPLFVDANSRKDALKKFLDEADLLKRLDHQRVVKLSDCFVEDHRGYLVLERIYGDSLYKMVLENGPFTEGRVLELLDQMLDVLSYLHSQVPPVVHRDFAPDNLILGQDGILKLVDFNVAQQTENSVVGTIVGKQSYVPPEQLRGMATPGSDIYALGATLYFLLTAQNPEPLSVSHPIDIVPHISKEIDQLVAGCTRLDEADRFKSVSEIREMMEKTLKWHNQHL